MDTKFKKGHKGYWLGKSTWNKGIPCSQKEKDRLLSYRLGSKASEKTKQKMRLAKLGIKKSLEHCKNISTAKKRLVIEGKHNWGDGTKSIERVKIYNSFQFRNWRKEVFKRDNYICQQCKVRGGYLEAHHIKPFSLFPELRFVIDNGITLCKKCHIKTDSYGYKIKKLLVKVEDTVEYPKQEHKPTF